MSDRLPTLKEPFAIVGTLVFDGYRFLQDQTVVVEEGVVARLGHRRQVEVGDAFLCIDGAGRTVLPGFIDCHVHIGLHDPAQVLQGGVTTARDLGWPEELIFPLANKLQTGLEAGPRLLAAGPMITAQGGYPTRERWAPTGTGLEVSTPAEAADSTERLLQAGASVIKVAQEPRQGPVMDLETLTAVVERAHSLGSRVTSHLGSLAQLEVALDAGVDELAHGLWSDESIPAEKLDQMVEAGIAVIPTLHIDPSRARIENLHRFLQAGGRVFYGTDMGNTGPPAGIDVVEMELMMQAGMSWLQVLSAATSEAAQYLGLEGSGILRQGAMADLLLVEGDVSETFEPLTNPIHVHRSS